MFEPVAIWAADAIEAVKRFVSGFVTGLLIIWFLPAAIRGASTAAMIGLLVVVFH